MITKDYENSGARCRDRTYDIRLVRAVDPKENNNLGPSKRIKTADSGVPRSTSGGTQKSRRDYNREYYRRTILRRRHLATHRRLRVRWTRWLLATLEWPAEPDLVVPVPQPIRRPLLGLPQMFLRSTGD